MTMFKTRMPGLFGISAVLFLLFSCEFPDPVPAELDGDFSREPFEIAYVAFADSMHVGVRPPRGASLEYCMRSLCGRTDAYADFPKSVVGVFALEDTISVLWSNLHGDTLRSLVRIDRQWFADGVVASGDTLRIRRPAGMVGPYWVYAGWGAMERGGGIRDTLEAGETMLEIVTPVAGAWSELSEVTFVPMRYVRDTIATDPLQYTEMNMYYWGNPEQFEGRCDRCTREK